MPVISVHTSAIDMFSTYHIKHIKFSFILTYINDYLSVFILLCLFIIVTFNALFMLFIIVFIPTIIPCFTFVSF